jgi:dTDP-glucose 4,6-dehydratase/UDP-glucose 4-epimerase
MRALIIGSKGFIGQHMSSYLSGKGYEVWGADVIIDYVHADHYFLIDASNSDYSTVFRDINYDLCVNCSGAASVPDSLKNPLRDFCLNTVNIFKILVAINRFQSNCRFINLSSAAIYGDPQYLPVAESARPNPLSPYGIHKLHAEQICREFYEFYKIPTCSLRIFSVYGVGLQKQLFWDLHQKATNGIPFILYGTGNESRDFINIFDLVKAIELASEFSNFEADIINIANGQEVLIKDAVSTYFSFFNTEIAFSFSGNSRKGDPANWIADIKKLKSIGYQPSVEFYTGLREYYQWAKAFYL